jgi:hypothetical protein
MRLRQELDVQRWKDQAFAPTVRREPRNSPDFEPSEHLESLLSLHHKVIIRQGAEPHVLVTFRTASLPKERTHFSVAKDDATPEAFAAALRDALDGDLAGVDIRVQAAEAPGSPAVKLPPPTLEPASTSRDPARREKRFGKAADALMCESYRSLYLSPRLAAVTVDAGDARNPLLLVHTRLAPAKLSREREELESVLVGALHVSGYGDLVDADDPGRSLVLLPSTAGRASE